MLTTGLWRLFSLRLELAQSDGFGETCLLREHFAPRQVLGQRKARSKQNDKGDSGNQLRSKGNDSFVVSEQARANSRYAL